MSSITHGMKKRMSKVATRKKTIEASISATYTTTKKQLQREKKALNDALALIDAAPAAWGDVAVKQKDFAELVNTEAPIEGGLHAASSPIVSAARAFQVDTGSAPSTEDKAAKIVGHVKAFIAEIDAVEGDYKKVETLYTESQRYEKKVGKLTSKDNKGEKTKRNVDKLEGARAAQQSAVDASVERMKKTSAKFEAVLQCAQTAFWLRQDKFVKDVVSRTEGARTAAAAVSDELEKMNVALPELKFVEKPVATIPETPIETAAAPAAAEPSATAAMEIAVPAVEEPTAAAPEVTTA